MTARPATARITPGPDLQDRLQDLFTRSYMSVASYVFEAEPYRLAEDAPVLEALDAVRQEDQRHAHMLAGAIEQLGRVPSAGAFPYWHRDLNYLSVPWLAGFVVETLEADVRRYDAALALWPADHMSGRAILEAIRADKVRRVETLRPVAVAALARERRTYETKVATRKQARADRISREKAAKQAARKPVPAAAAAPAQAAPAAAPVAAAPVPPPSPPGPAQALADPDEPGISPKERAKRQLARQRAKAAGAPAAAPVAAAAPAPATPPPVDVSSLPDPDEPGIAPKERAKRQMMRTRALAAASAAPAAPVPAAPAPIPTSPPVDVSSLPDPNEPGISPKERAKRQMMRTRALAAASATPAAAPAPAVPVAPPAPVVDVAALPDPDEPGISPKERAKRQIVRQRALQGAATPAAQPPQPQPAPAPAPASDVPGEDLDPDEPGISPKEKARRQILRMRRAKGA